jgi:hypothetical protein
MSQASAGGTPIASGQSCLVVMLVVMVADTQLKIREDVLGGYSFHIVEEILKKRRKRSCRGEQLLSPNSKPPFFYSNIQ